MVVTNLVPTLNPVGFIVATKGNRYPQIEIGFRMRLLGKKPKGARSSKSPIFSELIQHFTGVSSKARRNHNATFKSRVI